LGTAPRVDRQVLDASQAVSCVGSAPDHDIEDLLLLEEVTDGEARKESRGCPTDIAGAEAVSPRGLKVDFHLKRGSLERGLHAGVLHALDARDGREYLIGLLAQSRLVFTVDTG